MHEGSYYSIHLEIFMTLAYSEFTQICQFHALFTSYQGNPVE